MKTLIWFLFASLFFTYSLQAQALQYYTSNSGTSANSFPFSISGGKAVNYLILAGEINQPVPVPSGTKITKVYFRTSAAGTRTYNNLRILFAQSSITTLITGQFYTGPWDTVYSHNTVTLTSTAGGWMGIDLDVPYPYDPTRSLIMFIGQCGFTGTGTPIYNSTGLSGIRRTWSVGGCPFTPYAGGDGSLANFGIDVVPVNYYDVPELILYKFEDNIITPLATPNFASSPVGLNPAPIYGLTITQGGMHDSCLTGTGGSGASCYLETGWNCSFGSGNWTIGFWARNLLNYNPAYLWGDSGSGSFRCFYGGAALANNILIRGPFADILVSCPMPGQHYFHFVYDGTNVLIYKNGTLESTNPRTINLSAGTGFKVGAYSTANNSLGGMMDEFRIYDRALSLAEISATWNIELPIPILGMKNINAQIPENYSLSQNFPNPFNPVTNISYSIPKAGNVKLVVYDVLGREVTTLVKEVKTPGSYTVSFDASNLASGVYIYRMEAGNFAETKKMILIR